MEELAEHPADGKQEWGLTAELPRTASAAMSGSEAECHIEMFIGAGRAARFDSANVCKIAD